MGTGDKPETPTQGPAQAQPSPRPARQAPGRPRRSLVGALTPTGLVPKLPLGPDKTTQRNTGDRSGTPAPLACATLRGGRSAGRPGGMLTHSSGTWLNVTATAATTGAARPVLPDPFHRILALSEARGHLTGDRLTKASRARKGCASPWPRRGQKGQASRRRPPSSTHLRPKPAAEAKDRAGHGTRGLCTPP